MKIGVDIDGTLTRDTEQLKKLMFSVSCFELDSVYIITGCIDDKPSEEERKKQLEEMGVFLGPHYIELVRCNGKTGEEVAIQKAEFCRDNQIDIMFEDYDPYIKAINEISPKTSTWLIRRF